MGVYGLLVGMVGYSACNDKIMLVYLMGKYVCMYVCMYLCMYVYTYIYMCIVKNCLHNVGVPS